MGKSRLESMKERAGANAPGITIAIIALVLALAGGAFAASGALTGKQKKEVEKIAKKSGKPGKPGAPGAQGPQGPAGPQGASGAKGDKGDPGGQGIPGTSVTNTTEPPGTTNCGGRGGSKFVVGTGTATFACNGQQGADGAEGSPWTAGGVLPPGATETGAWTFHGNEANGEIWIPISFPIRMPVALAEEHTHYGEANSGGAFVTGTGLCPGSTTKPEAAEGELCVYQYPPTAGLENATFEGIFRNGLLTGSAKYGAVLRFAPTADGATGNGSFAITGCEPNEAETECETS